MTELNRVPARFINVDLELRSANVLDSLVSVLESKLTVLHHGDVDGDHFASFEVPGPGPDEPDACCRILLDVLENLSAGARRSLKACDSISFALGFEGGDSVLSNAAVDGETLRRIANLKASLTITIYPRNPDRS